MAQAIRSMPIRCLVLCRTTVDRPLRTLSRRAALQLMQAIPASLRPLLTISEALLSFAYLTAASISVHLRLNRGTPGGTPLPTLARLRRDKGDRASGCAAPESFLIAGWQMTRPQSTGKAQMKTILMLIAGLMLAGCGSMENHVRNRDAVDAICACP